MPGALTLAGASIAVALATAVLPGAFGIDGSGLSEQVRRVCYLDLDKTTAGDERNRDAENGKTEARMNRCPPRPDPDGVRS